MDEKLLEDLTRAAIAAFLLDERDEYILVLNYADDPSIRASEEVVLTITRRHRIMPSVKVLEMAAV